MVHRRAEPFRFINTLAVAAALLVSCAPSAPVMPAATALGGAAAGGAQDAATPLPPALDGGVDEGLRARARAIAEGYGLAELAGRLLMVSADGSDAMNPWYGAFLADIRPGALILFGRNVPDDPYAMRGLTSGLRSGAHAQPLPPFVAIDHEGGDVFRFKRGLTRLPAAAELGRGGAGAASLAGRIAAAELSALGVSLNLAPVSEALLPWNVAFLGGRAWSDDPIRAGELAYAFVEASQAAGLAATLKHFPGNKGADPHEALPLIDEGPEDFERYYLSPFRIALRARPAAVMLSHAAVASFGDGLPATLSPAAIGLLKGELGFEGVVLSDDLVMAALGSQGGVAATAIAALRAGADLLMVSGAREARAARDALRAAMAADPALEARGRDAAYRAAAQALRFGAAAPLPELSAEAFSALVGGHRAELQAASAPPAAAGGP